MNYKKFIAAAVFILGALGWYYSQPSDQRPHVAQSAPGPRPGAAFAAQGVFRDEAARAFADQADGRLITVRATVDRLLADDREGSPHQRFVVRTASGQTLMVAHNIDLAQRLDGLRTGDAVVLYGEYVWNNHGGLMHWTHHDPSGRHAAGYIEWQGRRYQ
ncbi:MAG: DUF3465 domain-containing protein [Pseudomonadota bacterium]